MYRLFDAHFDEVQGQWEERYEQRYGFWRSFVDEQVRRYLVRYYGWCSNVSRGKRRKAEAENGEVGDTGVAPASRAARAEARDARVLKRSWAQMIKRIYEVDPLVCPCCGSEMKVVAFITKHDVIDAILRHLERKESQDARGPPN